MARPKAGEARDSKQARLPSSFLAMAQKVAERRGVPVGDVIARASRRVIERAYKRIIDTKHADLGGEAGSA